MTAVDGISAGGAGLIARYRQKLLPLVGLIFLENANVLITRYTRSSPNHSTYEISHVMLTTEIAKFLLASGLEMYFTKCNLWASLRHHFSFRTKKNGSINYAPIQVALPAVLFYIQNTLFYVGLTNLSPPVFQVTYQMKLLWTAFFSILLLNRQYSRKQWFLMFCLCVGVTMAAPSSSQPLSNKDRNLSADMVAIGMVAVTLGSICSSLAGVVFEKYLKQKEGDENPRMNSTTVPEELKDDEADHEEKFAAADIAARSFPVDLPPNVHDYLAKPSLWMRNIQLALFSIACAILQQTFFFFVGNSSNHEMIGRNHDGKNSSFFFFFEGFTLWVWVLIVLRASNGLLVAIIIKNADNVVKQMASGLSSVVGCILSMAFFHTSLSLQFIFGAGLVLISCYHFPSSKNDSLPVSMRRLSCQIGDTGNTMYMKRLLVSFVLLALIAVMIFTSSHLHSLSAVVIGQAIEKEVEFVDSMAGKPMTALFGSDLAPRRNVIH